MEGSDILSGLTHDSLRGGGPGGPPLPEPEMSPEPDPLLSGSSRSNMGTFDPVATMNDNDSTNISSISARQEINGYQPYDTYDVKEIYRCLLV
jgi:hypothetical protein